MFNKVAIIAKQDQQLHSILHQVVSFLRQRGTGIFVDPICAQALGQEPAPEEALQGCELGVVIGGDGTMLAAARQLAPHGVPLLGINMGRIGFLADVPPAQLLPHLDAMLSGHYQEEWRLMLEYQLERDGKPLYKGVAVNDVALQKWNIARLAEFETRIDGRFVHRQRGDGVLVTTPTGSTGYSLACGGPILSPSLEVLALVPICPHTFSKRPLVIHAECQIEVLISPNGPDHAGLCCDGHIIQELIPGDRVQIRKHERRLYLIHPADYEHFSLLRSKLQWSQELC